MYVCVGTRGYLGVIFSIFCNWFFLFHFHFYPLFSPHHLCVPVAGYLYCVMTQCLPLIVSRRSHHLLYCSLQTSGHNSVEQQEKDGFLCLKLVTLTPFSLLQCQWYPSHQVFLWLPIKMSWIASLNAAWQCIMEGKLVKPAQFYFVSFIELM